MTKENGRPERGRPSNTHEQASSRASVPAAGDTARWPAKRRYASRAIIRAESEPLSHYAMVVLAVMATWADAESAEPVCFKDQESIARRAKLSVSTVGRALRELELGAYIKRLGVVGGGRDTATGRIRRGTIKWGLILLWGDHTVPQTDKDHTVPQTDKDHTVPQTDKDHTVPQTDKGPAAIRSDRPISHPVPQTDKRSVPQTDKPISESERPLGSDDDSAAPTALRPGGLAPVATSTTPALLSPATTAADPLVGEVMTGLGMTEPQAVKWIGQTLGDRKVSNRVAYVREAMQRQRAAEAAAIAKPATPRAAKPTAAPKPTKAAPAERCRHCDRAECRNMQCLDRIEPDYGRCRCGRWVGLAGLRPYERAVCEECRNRAGAA